MSDDGVYVRRVRSPEPMLEALARQVVDEVERWKGDGLTVSMGTVVKLASEAGVPLDYILDERERRVRAARTPEKSEGS